VTSPRRQQPVDGPRRCHYADDPARRPRCTLTATVRYGAAALCPPCNAARSTLGKGQTPVPLPAGPAFDVLGWVATAHQQAGAAEATLAAAVTRAPPGRSNLVGDRSPTRRVTSRRTAAFHILPGCLKTSTPYGEANAWNQHTQQAAA
jgi:hypothetical protein